MLNIEFLSIVDQEPCKMVSNMTFLYWPQVKQQLYMLFHNFGSEVQFGQYLPPLTFYSHFYSHYGKSMGADFEVNYSFKCDYVEAW